jgi:putative ABC transport system permease protein
MKEISLLNLLYLLPPVLVVIWLGQRWGRQGLEMTGAMVRMLLQLLAIGYVLTWLFRTDSSWLALGILLIMVAVSAQITVRSAKHGKGGLYVQSFLVLALGGGGTLFLIVWGVLSLDPWYQPRYMIPLAGMVFANCMNAMSLAIERYQSERSQGMSYLPARAAAFRASLLPKVNMLMAVGLVSIPGMMTGQILSGTSPLIAVRYQIMVMAMVLASGGITSAMILHVMKPKQNNG